MEEHSIKNLIESRIGVGSGVPIDGYCFAVDAVFDIFAICAIVGEAVGPLSHRILLRCAHCNLDDA